MGLEAVSLWDRLLSPLAGYARRRSSSQPAEQPSRLTEALHRLVERELAQAASLPAETAAGSLKGLAESIQPLGNPWWAELQSVLPDEAWRRGLPEATSFLAYGWADEATVAHNDQLRENVRKICASLFATHPHARGAVMARAAYVCGPHSWTVDPTPKLVPIVRGVQPVAEEEGDEIDSLGGVSNVPPVRLVPRSAPEAHGNPPLGGFASEVNYHLQALVRARWRREMAPGRFHPSLGWNQLWAEATLRFYRDGEVFIHLGNDTEDQRLSLRFLEPSDISTPAGHGVSAICSNGVETDPADPARVVAYHWRPSAYSGLDRAPTSLTWSRLDASRVLHLKHGVDSGVKRGLPFLFTVRNYLRHFDAWIYQALRAQRIQSSIALLRQWAQSDEATVRANLIENQKQVQVTRATPAGASVTYTTTDQMPVIDAPAGMTLNAFAPRGNFGDSEILVRRLLLAVASGLGMSEAMLTADGSNANYASTRITQLVPMRYIETDQMLFAGLVEQVYRKWYATESLKRRLPPLKDDLELDCSITPSRLPNFEAEATAGMASGMVAAGIWSRKTAQEATRVDPEVEEERLRAEQGEAEARQAIQAAERLKQEPLQAGLTRAAS